MIYVVLGMHKSGTTMVAEMLHRSGIPMLGRGDGDPAYDSGIKYERVATAELNKDILCCRDLYSLDILPEKRAPQADESRKADLQMVVDGCSQEHLGSDWGFKDPRTTITYPLWKEVLGEHRIVAVYRHPAQVLQHYWRRKLRRHQPLLPVRTLRAWSLYNRTLLDILASSGVDWLLLQYEELMQSESALHRLETFLQRPVTDVRRAGGYRMRKDRSPLLDLADLYCRWFGGYDPYRLLLEQLAAKKHDEPGRF